MKASRGFTLIEVMITVAIVAILAAIALPSYNDSVRKSRRGQAKADMLEVVQMLERRYSTNRTYVGIDLGDFGLDQSPRDGTARYTLTLDPLTASTYTLTAVPQGAQADDTRCGTLQITHLGAKSISSSTGTVAECW